MNDREEQDGAVAGPQDTDAKQELLPPERAGSATSRPGLPAPILFPQAFRAEPIEGRTSSRRSLRTLAAAAAVTALLLGGALWAINDHRSQAGVIAEQADNTQALARTIETLNARLNVIESVRSRDELVELRRSVGEIRSNVASSHELGAALAQLAQRVEKLDRDGSAKVDKLNERVDRATTAQAAELGARIDKLEKKVVASAAPQPAPANPPAPPQKQPAAPPKFGPNVSMDTTASINRPRPILQGYIVLGARDDVALIEGRNGERAVRRGDILPGAGRVESITRAGSSWVVLTEQGQIVAADESD